MKKSLLMKLKKRLPRNYAETISEETGLSKILVLKVLAGERSNEKIIEATINLAEKHKQGVDIAEERINKL